MHVGYCVCQDIQNSKKCYLRMSSNSVILDVTCFFLVYYDDENTTVTIIAINPDYLLIYAMLL